SSIGEMEREIHELEEKIEKYNDIIKILEEKRGELQKERGIIINDAYAPEKAYDMTRSSKWRGKREEDAKDHQDKIKEKTKKGITATGQLLDDIETAIQNLLDKIEACKRRISYLRHKIEELERQQQGNNEAQ
ncbi:YwqH-like family protein, partial [Butyrivibrio sp. XB500-5]|uniref:YwqH-like family protein n=1 Tax=Butyrivibrio sp. XB500-5 TaxID=2364880 RepID=UPI0011C224B5